MEVVRDGTFTSGQAIGFQMLFKLFTMVNNLGINCLLANHYFKHGLPPSATSEQPGIPTSRVTSPDRFHPFRPTGSFDNLSGYHLRQGFDLDAIRPQAISSR